MRLRHALRAAWATFWRELPEPDASAISAEVQVIEAVREVIVPLVFPAPPSAAFSLQWVADEGLRAETSSNGSYIRDLFLTKKSEGLTCRFYRDGVLCDWSPR